MAQQIWDEGRVVGLSAYELYVREYLTQNPNGTPLSQSQWLANTILSGNSLLIKVNANSLSTTDFICNIELPQDCPLYAANTIVGSFFIGKGHYASGSNVANWVESYGPLLPNSPSMNPADYDDTSITQLSILGGDYSSYQSKLNQYLSIVDGIIIQPGTWSQTTPTGITPGYILSNPSDKPILRLYLPNKGDVEFDFEILLTGFTDDSLVTRYQAPMPTNLPTADPLSGDFLGPAIRPWANKVIFSIPTWAISNLKDQAPKLTVSNQYQAGLSTGGSVKALALTNNQGTPYELNPSAGAQGTIDIQFIGEPAQQTATLTWAMLLDSLVNGKPIRFVWEAAGSNNIPVVFNLTNRFYRLVNATPETNSSILMQFLSNIKENNNTYSIKLSKDGTDTNLVGSGLINNPVSFGTNIVVPADSMCSLTVDSDSLSIVPYTGYQLIYNVNGTTGTLSAGSTQQSVSQSIGNNTATINATIKPPKIVCIYNPGVTFSDECDLQIDWGDNHITTVPFSDIGSNMYDGIYSEKLINYASADDFEISIYRPSISTCGGYGANIYSYEVQGSSLALIQSDEIYFNDYQTSSIHMNDYISDVADLVLVILKKAW